MNEQFHFLDIVFFAMVAAFLILRLRSVLGKRTGNERPPQEWRRGPAGPAPSVPDNVIDLARARKPAEPALPEGPVGDGLRAIMAADPDFTPNDFLTGARAAFEMIVGAYAAGDRQALKPLLADDVYRRFVEAIDTREKAGETLENELISIRAADIIEARLEGSDAVVTVRYRTEQINVIKDSEGRIVDGDPGSVSDVVDEWTFRRDTRSRDPNWQLAATHSPDDAS